MYFYKFKKKLILKQKIQKINALRHDSHFKMTGNDGFEQCR